ncbi:MAG: putative iron-sulfur-binding oxidoreductase FadF [Anaerolineae bacterium]|nr:putative iron-sulfur-binding oxidoreductase FadF [Anaerolineae bacterium]
MLTLIEKILFLIAVGGSLALAAGTFGKMWAVVRRGHTPLNLADLSGKLGAGLSALVTQGRIIRHRKATSIFHYFIAWGFIYYVLVNVIDVLEGLFFGFRLTGPVGNVYRLLADGLTVAVLLGMTYFLVRRFIAHAPALAIRKNVTLHPQAAAGMRRDSLLVGGFIWGHVGFRFLGAAFLVALHGRSDPWQPFASLLALPLGGLPPLVHLLGWHLSWWLAIGLILAFVPYFPYTKHAHLFAGPFNLMTRPPRRALGALPAINFDDESIEQFGATTLTDLSQTQLVDAFACIMCSRCQDVCPAYATGKVLSPSALEINKRYHIWDKMDALAAGEADESPLLEWAISPEAVWACTTCGACIEVCPVGNEPMFDIMDIRRSQVLMDSQFPAELKGAFTGLERNGNPWQMAGDRLAWAEPLDFAVPTVKENPDFEVLFWVGCAGAFDPAAQEIARATATVLHAAGVNFAVLGNDESCTGDTARRAGNEYLFFEMAQANIETLNAAGADKKKIVASCPHCLHTLGTEYADFGGHYTVLHHTQLISELIGSGRLKLNRDHQLEKVTFHDPCYLGRHNGVYAEPRAALSKAGATLLEMGRSRSDSFCCGAGGAQMWKEEEHGTASVSETRFAEARATGAEVLAVGCPFCARMLTDANTNAGSPLVVRDVAQVVAAALAE